MDNFNIAFHNADFQIDFKLEINRFQLLLLLLLVVVAKRKQNVFLCVQFNYV